MISIFLDEGLLAPGYLAPSYYLTLYIITFYLLLLTSCALYILVRLDLTYPPCLDYLTYEFKFK